MTRSSFTSLGSGSFTAFAAASRNASSFTPAAFSARRRSDVNAAFCTHEIAAINAGFTEMRQRQFDRAVGSGDARGERERRGGVACDALLVGLDRCRPQSVMTMSPSTVARTCSASIRPCDMRAVRNASSARPHRFEVFGHPASHHRVSGVAVMRSLSPLAVERGRDERCGS